MTIYAALESAIIIIILYLFLLYGNAGHFCAVRGLIFMKGGALHADDPSHDTLPIEYMPLCRTVFDHIRMTKSIELNTISQMSPRNDPFYFWPMLPRHVLDLMAVLYHN